MRWTPLNQGNALATLIGAHEKAVIDFKKEYDLRDLDKNDGRFEIAKDIAAFANHLGGTIVVGAVENPQTGKLVAFNSVQDEKRLVQALDQALNFCLPPPVATHEQIDLDAQTQDTILGRPGATGLITLVAINVQPYLNGPIGAKIWRESGKKGEAFNDAFRFPCRGAEGTRYLRPEELALAMNSHERRILLQLEKIEPDLSITLWTPQPLRGGITTSTTCKIVQIDHEGSVILVESQHPEPYKCEIPVALIRAIWRTRDGWNMGIEGSIN